MPSATVSSIPEVIARLREIESSAPASDGVACFARLYREVTEAVGSRLAADTFADPRFVARLDVGFAGLFFGALDAAAGPGKPPSAWAPLFACRSRRGIAPLQFALAGMNAHINRDLPVALVATCTELGLDLSKDDSAAHRDYLEVNALLAQVESRIKSAFLSGWVSRLDRLLHRVDRLDDVVAMWDVSRARDAAWTNGQALWQLRHDPELAAGFLRTLDKMVGLGSRGLLVPAESRLAVLARRLAG